jgi:hypothetical protein
MISPSIGQPLNRVDGQLKVTGAAKYSAEYAIEGLVHAVLVGSTIARGRIANINTSAAERSPMLSITRLEFVYATCRCHPNGFCLHSLKFESSKSQPGEERSHE